MKMHLLLAAVVLAAGISAVSPVQASVQFATSGSQVALYNGPGGNGGIFYVDVYGVASTFDVFNTTYNGAATTYDFPTFCVEISEHINLSNSTTQYIYTVANDVPITFTTSASNKTLGSFAAWLYTKFLEPVLTGGAGLTGLTGFSSWDSGDANAVQYGIWKSMGWDTTQILNNLGSYDGTFLTSLMTAYSLDMSWTAGLGLGSLDSNWNNGTTVGNVRILNLIGPGDTTTPRQDQLVWSPPPPTQNEPTPEPVSVFVWSMLTLCVSSAGRRRRG